MKSLFLILSIFQIVLSQESYQKWAQKQNIPPLVIEALANAKLDSNYIVSFHLNPFYLRGDLNGDGDPDYAVLIKNVRSRKIGIAVIDSKTKKVVVLGAGKTIGNGGDDFKWMDAWYIHPKGPVNQGVTESTPPKIVGDALHVFKLEAASGIIYWSGTKYEWYQQGD